VYADRNGFAVQNSRVSVKLPSNVTATKAEAYGVSATVSGVGESTIIAEAKGSIDSGQELEIRVQFPHGILTGQSPAWQAAFDQQRAFQETTQPIIDFGVLLASLLIFVGGPGLAIVLWYRRGRDPQVGLIAEYLNEPPAKLTPGVAGTLVDERVDMQDIIATLVDLARRGVLTMTESGKTNRSGLVYDRDWTFSHGPRFNMALSTYESRLINALGLDTREQRDLSDLKNQFYTKIDSIKNALYDQLVADGYYNRSPNSTRNTYGALGVLGVVLTCITGMASMALSDYTNLALCLPIALGVTTVAFFIIAAAMPARTRSGADMRMRAEAFKRYLANIEKYTDIKTATDQFDKYLPYAIAFGLDTSWVNKFAAVNAPAPVWYIPYMPYYGHSQGGLSSIGGGMPTGGIGGAAQAAPSLEGVNKSLGAGLTNINTGLAAMFTTVSSTFVSTPAPKSSGGGGGGWSGGGGGGGGGSGGGGGGFG